ncbi:unnamed protein product [Pocillopora meandrina]|uniref:Uncharacterized protein n=1 Tax=Pocillopora meandrina TaxID=46732 RepID=A0AAU9WV46_9CNID|nr:unnamed protein product [Pocillopora meandrina]
MAKRHSKRKTGQFLLPFFMTYLTVGSLQPMNGLNQDFQGHLPPALESANDTLRTSPHVAKRFINSRACREIFSSINPQMYFQSNDIFFPKFVRTVKCEGTPNNPVHCGSAQGSMRCLTRMSDVKVMRIPSSGQCSWRRPVMIRNVPVGCYCEY